MVKVWLINSIMSQPTVSTDSWKCIEFNSVNYDTQINNTKKTILRFDINSNKYGKSARETEDLCSRQLARPSC